MKLHLPKQLFTALLAAITLAAPAAWGVNDLGINRAGNFWAADYAFSFILNDDAFKNGNTVVLGKYYGSAATDGQGANAIVAIKNEDGISLQIGQGGGANFTFYSSGVNSKTFTGLQTGVVYTLDVTGASGAMKPILYTIADGTVTDASTETDATVTYNGNMNGDPGANGNISSEFNSSVATLVSASGANGNVANSNILVWAGKAAENATSASWGTWKSIDGSNTGTTTGATADANSILYFDATGGVAKEVDISGSINVASIKVYADYSFNAVGEGAASLSVTNGLTVAGGKTLTLNKGLSLTLNGAVELDGSSLTTQYSNNGYAYSATTSSLAGNGTYVAGDNLTLNGSSVSAITKTDSGVRFDVTGTVYHVVAGEEVKLGENGAPVEAGSTHTGYEVHENATLDINGKIALRQSVWLNANAKLTNTGMDIGNTSGDNKGVNKQQISHVYLKGNASVTNTGQMGIINSNWAATTLDLAGHTLTKTGFGMFSVANAAISAGTIDIQGGEFLLSHLSHGSASLRVDDDVKVNVAEGAKLSITGTHSSRLDADFLLNSTGAGTISIHRDVSMGSSSKESAFAGTISVVSGELRLGNAADSGGNAMQEIGLSDASLNMDGGTFRYFGGTSTIGTLNVNSTPSSFSIHATNNDNSSGKLTFNKVNVAAQQRLLITPHWSVNVDIGELTGAGSIQFATGAQAGASACIYTIGSVASGFGSISNAGTLKLGAEGKTVHLGRTVENTGSITLDGILVIENLDFDHYEVAGGTYYNSASDNATESNSGYGALTYQIIKGGTVTIGDSFSYAGSGRYSMTNGLVVTDSNVDTSRFFVNENIKWNAVGNGVDFTTTQYSDDSATTFIVAEGKKLDVNGNYFAGKHFWLGVGATLQNTGSLLHGGSQQFQSISLTGDAYLNSWANMGLIGSGDYSATELNLNGNKLTKQGDGAFLLLNTTVNGGGTIQVDAGVLQIGVELNSGVNADVTAQDTHFVLNGGELSVQKSGNQLTAASVSGTGDVTGAGSLVLNGTGDYTLDGQLSVHSLTNSTNLTVTGAASSRNVTNTGKLLFEGEYNVGNNTLALESGTAANAEAIKFASDVTASNITIGASNNSGSNSLGTVSFLDDVDVSGKFYARKADFVFGDGATAGVATLGRIELGDSETSSYTHTGTISNNYTVVVTGNNNTASYKDASLILGEWNTKTTLNVNGNLLAKNAKMQLGDSGGTLHINNGGTVAVMGISRAKTDNGKNPVFTLTMSEGGKLVLGSDGLDVVGSGAQSYTLNGGTLGISAESVTVNEDLTVSGNVTFDTTLYEFNDAGTTLTQGTSSGTLTVNKINVSANDIKVNFNGAGNHVIANIDPGSYTGITYNVKNGATLKVSGSMLMNNSSICLEDGASFNMSDNILVTGTGADSTIATAEADSSLTTDNAAYTISNAEVEMTHSAESTLGMKLTESSLTSSGSSLLTVTNAGNTITSLAANGGNVTLSENMTVKSISAKADMVVTVADGKTIKMDGGVDISTNGADATMTAKNNNALARLQEDASFTIEDMTLTNTTITAATTTEVKLTNVSASATQLSGGKFVVTNQATMNNTPQVTAGGSEGSLGTITASTTLLSGITLNSGSITVDLGDLCSYATMGPGKYDLSITLGGFSMGEYSGDFAGSALQFAAGSWLSELLAQGNNVQISITQAEEGAAAAAAGVSGGSTSVSYSTGNVGMVITINGLNVPEPSSATLGLAALMMLCARRRRKA